MHGGKGCGELRDDNYTRIHMDSTWNLVGSVYASLASLLIHCFVRFVLSTPDRFVQSNDPAIR